MAVVEARPSSARARPSSVRSGASAARSSAIVRTVFMARVASRRRASVERLELRPRLADRAPGARSTVAQSPREIGPVSSKPFSIVRRISGSSASGGAPAASKSSRRGAVERDEVVRGDRGARVVERRASASASSNGRRPSSSRELACPPRAASSVSAVTAAQAPSSCSGPRRARERLQRVDAEAALVRVERGERRRAADVRDPGAGLDRSRATSAIAASGTQSSTSSASSVAHGDAPLGEPGGDSRADAASRAGDANALDHGFGLQLPSGMPGAPEHTRAVQGRVPGGRWSSGCRSRSRS